MPKLIALAGPSRSGKGSCAEVIHEMASARGLTVCERQLSGPGKQYLASAFRPDITEQEAIDWFEEMKTARSPVRVSVGSWHHMVWDSWKDDTEVSLQQYLQRMIQGARDRWGDSFWTDKLLPLGSIGEGSKAHEMDLRDPDFVPAAKWRMPFFQVGPMEWEEKDIALISDLRQVNEAQRVRELGGIVIEMHRPENDDAYRTGVDHVTEQRLPAELVDATILNNGTLEQLRAACASTVYPILEPA